jgi:hypothetical protein
VNAVDHSVPQSLESAAWCGTSTLDQVKNRTSKFAFKPVNLLAATTRKLETGAFNVNSPDDDLTYDANHLVVPFDYLAELDERVLFLASTIVLFSSYLIYELVVPSVPKVGGGCTR